MTSRRLLALTAAAFVVLAAEPSYLLVDTAVVGHLGNRQLGGLGIAAAVVGLLLVVGDFVEYGTTGRAARAFGAGDLDGAHREGVQASWLAVATGLVLLVAGQVFATPLAHALAGDDPAVRRQAVAWLRIGLVGQPAVLLVLAGNGWMRGVQETRAPVRIVVLANSVSAVLCPVLVYPVGLGLRGSAIANLIGQALAAGLFVRSLRGSLRPLWSIMVRQLRVGRDLVVRNVGFEASGLVAAGVAARMGTPQLAAHQIGLQLDTFCALALDSVAIAAQSLVGAALGASDAGTARHVAWKVMRWGGYAGVAFAAVFAAGWWLIPRAFTSSGATLHQAHVMWPWLVAALVPAGALFALDGVLMGAGDVAYMAVLTLVAGLVFFAPIDLAALHFGWGLGGVWAGLLAFYVVRLVGMVARTRSGRWAVLGNPDVPGEPPRLAPTGRMHRMTLWLTPDDGANALLADDPLALLLGMLLDQQIPMEKAFRGPYDLKERLGSLDAAAIAQAPDLEAVFARTPAIHRFPGSMARRVQAMCAYLVEHHGGRADDVWTGAGTGDELLARLTRLPGFGPQKAKIFVALLGKQLGVRPPGWREAAGEYGEDGALRSIADVTGEQTMLAVRAHKQSVKAAAKAARA